MGRLIIVLCSKLILFWPSGLTISKPHSRRSNRLKDDISLSVQALGHKHLNQHKVREVNLSSGRQEKYSIRQTATTLSTFPSCGFYAASFKPILHLLHLSLRRMCKGKGSIFICLFYTFLPQV
ncbi:hypothetical protein BKA61DRAFT_119599 [Leptodontidium sp. MPI-SDFR-AT-0119]|nr:hypothetical protein BKA61DRAFT_119599 [Leptodontidium sp. MPI-SDFR-AT-0119]